MGVPLDPWSDIGRVVPALDLEVPEAEAANDHAISLHYSKESKLHSEGVTPYC